MTERSTLSKTENLLKGLEILNGYFSLGLNQAPLSFELRRLIEAMRYVKKEEVIKETIQLLHEVNEIVDNYEADKSMLIQILLDVQAQKHWLPEPALIWVSLRLEVPLARIYSIASFYKAFSLKPKGRYEITVCLGTACHVRGGPRILEALERTLGIKAGETTSDGKFSLEGVNCVGCCALGPVMVVNGQYYGGVSPKRAEKVLSSY